MKIEHFALNVPDPNAMSRWYVANLGFTVARRLVDEPYTHFLADSSGTVMLEVYRQSAPLLEFHDLHSMSIHLALVSDDIESDIERLTAAGARLDGGISDFPNGDRYAMLRDPWGVTLQLVKRAVSMI